MMLNRLTRLRDFVAISFSSSSAHTGKVEGREGNAEFVVRERILRRDIGNGLLPIRSIGGAVVEEGGVKGNPGESGVGGKVEEPKPCPLTTRVGVNKELPVRVGLGVGVAGITRE